MSKSTLTDGYFLVIEKGSRPSVMPIREIGVELASRPQAEAAARWHRDRGGNAVVLVHVVNGRAWVLSRSFGLPSTRTATTDAGRMHADTLAECYRILAQVASAEVVA